MGVLGLGAAGTTAYWLVPVSKATQLGLGSIVKLKRFPWKDDRGNIGITGRNGPFYLGAFMNNPAGGIINFRPADIANIVQQAPTVPLLT